MKTRKLLFTLVATMTMMFGLTLTAHAEEAAPAPATKVVGVEGIGTFTVPADWTEEYIEGYGTYWFNPTKTACVAMSTTGDDGTPNPPIEVFAPILKQNLEAAGYVPVQWNVTKYFGHDAIEYIECTLGDNDFPATYQVFSTASTAYGHGYYAGSCIIDVFTGATTIEELQTALPIFATYQPAQ